MAKYCTKNVLLFSLLTDLERINEISEGGAGSPFPKPSCTGGNGDRNGKTDKAVVGNSATAVVTGGIKCIGEQVEVQPQSPASQTTEQGDKAAKVAALSQALNVIDKFRKSQENKEEKSRMRVNASEIDDLATNLQVASQVGRRHPSSTVPTLFRCQVDFCWSDEEYIVLEEFGLIF